MNINIGIIGAGNFSAFSMAAFLEVDGVSCTGVFDIARPQSEKLSALFGCHVFDTQEDLLRSDQVDLAYIATPPFLHYEQSKAALLAGKHVICEKPAALNPDEARELARLAEDKGLLYVVNLMQRYNPLYRKVGELIDKKYLGDFLHGFFENYASDVSLHRDHWMWDEQQSGGIFIEHGVHFFDMFSGWLGHGEVVSSQKLQREGYPGLYSRVQAIVSYRNALVNISHGFDQTSGMDRQELRLLFERGEVTLFEWVPVKIVLNGLVNSAELAALKEVFPGASIDITDNFPGEKGIFSGNFKKYRIDHKIKMTEGDAGLKGGIYKYILTEMLRDQLLWVHDRSHQRIITAKNGIDSLAMAYEANINVI